MYPEAVQDQQGPPIFTQPPTSDHIVYTTR